MPEWIPGHHAWVLFTGVCEIAGAVGLFLPKTRIAARNLLIAFLLAVFPVNIHMAINAHLFANIPPLVLWLRLPLQFVLIFLIVKSTSDKTPAH